MMEMTSGGWAGQICGKQGCSDWAEYKPDESRSSVSEETENTLYVNCI